MPEEFDIWAIARLVVSSPVLWALVAMGVFYATINQPNHLFVAIKNEKLVDSSDILLEAENSAPERLMVSGQIGAAVELAYDLVEKKPHDVLANLVAGDVLVYAGEQADGFLFLRRALALAPDNRWLCLNLANKLAIHQHFQEAINQYQRLICDFPGWAKPHEQLANIYQTVGKPQMAVDEYKKALQEDPNNGAIRMLYGLALARANCGREGLDQYVIGEMEERHLAGLPPDLKLMVGYWGSLEKVAKELKQQLSERPNDTETKVRLARVCIASGQLKDARLLLTEASVTESGNAYVHRNLAVVLQRLGEPEEALKEFVQSVRLQIAQEHTTSH